MVILRQKSVLEILKFFCYEYDIDYNLQIKLLNNLVIKHLHTDTNNTMLAINIFRSFKYSMTNNIFFKSRIVFTTPDKFEKIFNSRINESNFVGEPWNLSAIRTKSNYLGTSSINNCTGFSLNSEEPLLGHLMTSEENFNNLDKIKSYIENYIQTHKIKSALIIGSKSPNTPIADFSHLKGIVPDEYINNKLYDKNSFKLFQFIENIIKTLEPTIFKGHKYSNSNSSCVYDSKNDTMYICTYLDTFKNIFVKNKEDLKKAFDEIRLSSKDSLEFSV